MFYPQMVPGPQCGLKAQTSERGLKHPPLGMNKQKMHAEHTGRTLALEVLMEPYRSSCGPKHILEGIPQTIDV